MMSVYLLQEIAMRCDGLEKQRSGSPRSAYGRGNTAHGIISLIIITGVRTQCSDSTVCVCRIAQRDTFLNNKKYVCIF